MSAQPVLRALDADHDGEISATEIRNAWSELESLDHNGDHALEPEEMVPEYVVAAARSVLAALDQDHDGRIDAKERSGEAGARFRDLLEDADMDGDGIVTLDELIDEIFYRADLNKDGIVTAEELNQAARRGMLGPLSVATRFFSRLALQLPGKNVP
jgi:Ca2+-binding EF-hand superfamily protein